MYQSLFCPLCIPQDTTTAVAISRNQVIYSAFCIVHCIEVTCKGYFLIQQQCKEKIGH